MKILLENTRRKGIARMSETQYKLTSAESLESSIDFDFKKTSKENERLSLFNNSQPITTVKQHHQQSNSSVKSSLSGITIVLTILINILQIIPSIEQLIQLYSILDLNQHHTLLRPCKVPKNLFNYIHQKSN